MFKPTVQNKQKHSVTEHAEPYKTDTVHIFSDAQIRTRAYQIYESGNRNSNNPEADWSQAETELTELLHAK